MTSKKTGIVIGAVLFVLIAGTLGVLAIDQSVKAEYEAVNSWRETPEGMKNAFCHSAGLNFDVCMSNAIVYTDFYGNSKVSMPLAQKGVKLTADGPSSQPFNITEHCEKQLNVYWEGKKAFESLEWDEDREQKLKLQKHYTSYTSSLIMGCGQTVESLK